MPWITFKVFPGGMPLVKETFHPAAIAFKSLIHTYEAGSLAILAVLRADSFCSTTFSTGVIALNSPYS